LNLPESLADKTIVPLVHERLSSNGIMAMNIISSYYGRASDVIRTQQEQYDNIFSSTKVFPADSSVSLWQSQNFILLAQKGRSRANYGMRFGPVDDIPLAI